MGLVTILQNEILFLKRFYPRAELINKICIYNQKGEVRIMLIFKFFIFIKTKTLAANISITVYREHLRRNDIQVLFFKKFTFYFSFPWKCSITFLYHIARKTNKKTRVH